MLNKFMMVFATFVDPIVKCGTNSDNQYYCTTSAGKTITDVDKLFCHNTHSFLGILGWVIVVLKIAIPLVIIVRGIVGLGKVAVTTGKPEDLQKAIKDMAWRIAGGIAIYFIPGLVMMVMGLFSQWNTTLEDYNSYRDFDVCKACILKPYDSSCTNAKGMYD